MNSKNYLNRISSLIFFACLIYGNSVYAQINHKAGYSQELWTLDAEPTTNQFRVENSRARMIFFRLATSNDELTKAPLNIFINGQYHASLMPEHQSIALSVCPGKKNVTVSADALPNKNTPPFSLLDGASPALQAGEIYFYQVTTDQDGKVFARWVNRDMAREVLLNVKVQMHTISRVAKDDSCPTEIYSINSSALFKFARFDSNGMVKGARDSLSALYQHINENYLSIDKVIVKGFADPIGDDKRNLHLSEKRAETVANQLISFGLASSIISSQGMGASNLIVSDCDKHSTVNEAVMCNQPNRRVEIEVYGSSINSSATSSIVF